MEKKGVLDRLLPSYVNVLTFTTILSLLFFRAFGADVQGILVLKDLMSILIVLASLIYAVLHPGLLFGRNRFIYLLVLGIILANAASFVFSDASLPFKLLNLRRNTLAFVVFCAISLLHSGESKTFDRMIVQTKSLTTFILAVGVLDYLAPDSFWDGVARMPEYWGSVELDLFAADSVANSGRFYSTDLMFLLGKPIRRMVSIYLEPTTLAAFLACAYAVSYVRPESRRYRWLLACLGLLTISKHFLLSVISTNILVKRQIVVRPLYMILGMGLIYVFSTAIAQYQDSNGAISHVAGYASAFGNLGEYPLGTGLGTAGNDSAQDEQVSEAGAESGLGNCLAQLGYPAFLYVGLIIAILARLYQKLYVTAPHIYAVGCALALSWFISFLLSASSLGLSGNIFYFIFLGILCSDTAEEYHAQETAAEEGAEIPAAAVAQTDPVA